MSRTASWELGQGIARVGVITGEEPKDQILENNLSVRRKKHYMGACPSLGKLHM